MEIKKRKQRASYVPKNNHPLQCQTCKSWTKKQPDGTRICVTCHFRQKQQEQVERVEAGLPALPEVRIGKI